jgi:hypothetical protein
LQQAVAGVLAEERRLAGYIAREGGSCTEPPEAVALLRWLLEQMELQIHALSDYLGGSHGQKTKGRM